MYMISNPISVVVTLFQGTGIETKSVYVFTT